MDPDGTRPRRPAVVGDFELVRKLGSGGFGSVFEARHRDTGLPYAVKRIELSQDDAERFRKEALYPARIASRSLHVLNMHSFFQDEQGGYFYLVTELVPHGDLKKFLDEQARPLPLPLALEIAIAVARGLAAIHEQGIVHRDLKPGNVLMDRKDDRWVPKIADFGLARSSGSVSIGEFASTGYAAPEQVDLAADPHMGPEADMFSFGMVLYELLTGEKASDARDLREYGRWAHARQAPPPPSTRRRELATLPGLDDLMARLLEFDPNRRSISASEVAQVLSEALHAVQRGEHAPVSPVTRLRAAEQSPVPPVTQPSVRPSLPTGPPVAPPQNGGRRWMRVVAVAAVVVAVAVGGAFWFTRSADGGESRGIADFHAKRYAQALPVLLEDAGAGDSAAQAALGRMYQNGWGVQRDSDEARKWLQKAADQDHPDGQCGLGDLAREAGAASPTIADAARWYRAAADDGAACGQTGMGMVMRDGLGVPPNYDEALRWFEKAAGQGDEDARTAIRRMQDGWVMEPLFAGAWHSVEGTDRRDELDRLRKADVLNRVGALEPRRMRSLDVDFYEGTRLFELEIGRKTGLGVLAYLRKGDTLVMVDGKAAQIHAFSASAPVRIDQLPRAVAFLRFFMGAVQGDQGVFQVVDSERDVPWLPNTPPTTRDPFARLIRRFEMAVSPSGGWKAESTIQYAGRLFSADLWLKPDGSVEMTGDRQLAAGLPVALERFDDTGVRVRVVPNAS
jgi:serine/threonine-protein kinase